MDASSTVSGRELCSTAPAISCHDAYSISPTPFIVCCATERITVLVRVLNPLQVDLEVKNIRLRARHTGKDTGVTVAEGLIDPNPLPSSLPSSASSPYPPSTPFVIASQDIVLPAGESVMMALTLLPLTQGTLLIEGVQWDVLALHGFHQFALPPRSIPLGPGKRGQPQMQPDPSLSVSITAPAPLLAISLSNLPSQCFHGEYIQSSLQLTNIGAIGLTKLSVRVSHPGFVLLGLAEKPTSAASAPSPLANSASTPALSSHRQARDSSSYACYTYDWNDAGRIHLSLTLLPHQSLTLPVFIRGATEGQHLLSFLFRYEAVDADPSTASFRLGYVERDVKVRPLIGVRLFNKPSFAEVKDSLLGLDVHDRQAEAADAGDAEVDVRVDSVGVLSKCWVVAAIGEHPDTLAGPQPAPRSLSTQDLQAVRGKGRLGGGVVPGAAHACTAESVVAPHTSLLLFCRITNLPSLSLPSPLLQAQCPTQFTSVNFLPPDASPAPAAPDCTQAPHHNLLGMEKALMMEEERQSLIINPAAVITDVGAPAKLDLIVTWTIASAPPRFGFHHLPGVAIMKVLPSACPLKVHLAYPPTVLVPAAAAFPVTLPIQVQIRNILEDSPISFQFETLPPEEDFDPVRRQFRTLPSSVLRGRYAWHGVTRAKVGQLRGGEEAEVRLYVDVGEEGEYNLNRFRFTVEVGGGKKPRVFFFPLQHLVRVEREGGGGADKGAVSVRRVGEDEEAGAGGKRYEKMEEADGE